MDAFYGFVAAVWPAVITAWVIERLIGMIYYSPKLFGTTWMSYYRADKKNLDAQPFAFMYRLPAALIYDALVMLITIAFFALVVLQFQSLWILLFAWLVHSGQTKALAFLKADPMKLLTIDAVYLILLYGIMAAVFGMLLI